MKSQVLLTVWCNISGEAAGEIWHWSLSGVKGLSSSSTESAEPTSVSASPVARNKGGVTLVNLQRQLATPIRNACFSHEFADMIHFWIAFKNFQRVAALQISQKIVRNGVLHWNDFLRNIVSLQVGVASWPV